MHTKHDLTRIQRLATVLCIGAVGVVGVTLTGCNAVEGLGEDLQESSQNVKDAASGDDNE
ncbi:MAG: entericidin [Planctomycetota bacterium]